MKTTNVIILVGVLGVGGVGAYMYMKNKQAQDALLTGSLPATNQGGGFVNTPTTSGTPTTTTTPTGGSTTSPTGGATTPPLSTTSDGVSPSDANLNLANATVLVAERKGLVARANASLLGSVRGGISFGGGLMGGMNTGAVDINKAAAKQLAKQQLVELDAKLAKLGYKVDATGSLVKV
jgi:hypothetical protein